MIITVESKKEVLGVERKGNIKLINFKLGERKTDFAQSKSSFISLRLF